MLEIVDTCSIAASCQVCHGMILDKKNVKSNLGSGKYAYHYHIDCFKREYGDVIAKIMESQSEINPILVARAHRPKPLWRLRRIGQEYKLAGPDMWSSSSWLVSMVKGIKLDNMKMTTAVLAGKKYVAELIDQVKVKDILTCTNPYGKGLLYSSEDRKFTYIGIRKYSDAQNIEHLMKMYLIEGITK